MLAVTPKLQIGNWLYDTQLASLRLRRAVLPTVDRLTVDFPSGVKFEAAPGDDVELALDGGEGSTQVFVGKLSAVTHMPDALRITAHNGALSLARYRPVLALEQVSVGDIIKKLAGDVGVDTGSVVGGPSLALYASDGRATAQDEIARLAGHAAALAVFAGDGTLHVFDAASSGPESDVPLRFGRELLGAEAVAFAADPTTRTVVGDGAGGPGSSLARWPIVDFFGGSAPEAGSDARLRAVPELRTVADARVASQSWGARASARENPVRIRTWLVPTLAPGSRWQLQDAPGTLPISAARITQVIHSVSAGCGLSEVWGYVETAGGAGGGLLGAAAAAIGGLL